MVSVGAGCQGYRLDAVVWVCHRVQPGQAEAVGEELGGGGGVYGQCPFGGGCLGGVGVGGARIWVGGCVKGGFMPLIHPNGKRPAPFTPSHCRPTVRIRLPLTSGTCLPCLLCLTIPGPASHPGANFVVLSLDGARIWLRDEKIRRKLAAELKVGVVEQ